jgi:hypothetical protein
MIMRRRKMMMVVLAVVCGGSAFSVWAAGINVDQIPAKAREALQKLAGSNPIIKVESEKEHGVQVYEAAWTADGTKTEAEVTADGVLLEMEEWVKADKVPQAVRETAEKALAGASKLSYEKHTVVFYEVEGKVDGKKKEVSISPAGKLMSQEDEDKDDDDDDDNGG